MDEEFKKKHKFIFFMGATASGKSEWALALAQKLQGHIINCDSVQVYTELTIGSAQPSIADKQICPHHLYSYVSPMQEITVGDYVRDFWHLVRGFEKSQLFFVVGGTGFYFQALEKGLLNLPASNPLMIAQLEFELQKPDGPLRLYQELQQKDPESCLKIHPSDHYRLVRALEVIRSTGLTMSMAKKQKNVSQLQALKLARLWSPEDLRVRIQNRVNKMIEMGLQSEVEYLLQQGWEHWAPLRSVGYKETIEYLKHKNQQQWVQDLVTHTYQLSKKQRTWFKRDPELLWLTEFEQVESQVDNFLNNANI